LAEETTISPMGWTNWPVSRRPAVERHGATALRIPGPKAERVVWRLFARGARPTTGEAPPILLRSARLARFSGRRRQHATSTVRSRNRRPVRIRGRFVGGAVGLVMGALRLMMG
jgi:hypothetical protein